MEINNYITRFRETHGKDFFLNGGCYIFASLLKKKYGGFIYSNIDHCVLKKDGNFYDITGEVENNRYNPISVKEEQKYRDGENFNFLEKQND